MGRKANIRYDPITDVLSIDFGKYGVSSLTEEPLNGIFLIYGYEKTFHQGRRRLVALEHSRLSDLNERDLAEADNIGVPSMNIIEAGLEEASLGDVLRWAHKKYLSKMTDRESLAYLAEKLPDEKMLKNRIIIERREDGQIFLVFDRKRQEMSTLRDALHYIEKTFTPLYRSGTDIVNTKSNPKSEAKETKNWIHALCGKYRDMLTSSEQYFLEKQEEIEMEENKLTSVQYNSKAKSSITTKTPKHKEKTIIHEE